MRYPGNVWPGLDLIIWHAICFYAMCFRDNGNGGFKQEHVESCPSTTKNISTTTMSISTKRSMLVIYHEGFPPMTSHDYLMMWLCEITWQTKNISFTPLSVATELGRMVTYILITWTCKVTWQTKRISTNTVTAAIKLDRMNFGWLLPIKSHDPLITWSCQITWLTKTITYPPPQCLWLPNMAAITLMDFYSWRHMTLQSSGLARSRDKLKPLCLQNHSACCHQTWLDVNLTLSGFHP